MDNPSNPLSKGALEALQKLEQINARLAEAESLRAEKERIEQELREQRELFEEQQKHTEEVYSELIAAQNERISALKNSMNEKGGSRFIKFMRSLLPGLALFLISIAVFILFAKDKGLSISEAAITYQDEIWAISLATIGVGTLALALLYRTAGIRFRDVDLIRDYETKKVFSPADAWPFPTGTSDNSESDVDVAMEEMDSFIAYFERNIKTLEEKATNAEQKASILLDKGTSFTHGGIIFFVVSILAWQILSWARGFQTEFIYGIVSCATLFIFIEFLSAWFLKQYRHYIDTSTYLLKVKAIFDRYMLVYLALKNSDASGDDRQRHLNVLLELLSRDIKWPDAYLLKRGDVSFARETMLSITELTAELRRKNNKRK